MRTLQEKINDNRKHAETCLAQARKWQEKLAKAETEEQKELAKWYIEFNTNIYNSHMARIERAEKLLYR